MQRIIELEDQSGSVLIDRRFQYVVIASFYGETTEKLLLAFCDWYREHLEALSAGVKFVMINDPRGLRSGSPTVRKLGAEKMKELMPLMAAHKLENILVVDNALLRGAITAFRWLTGRDFGTPVKNMAEAVTMATQALRRAGLPEPVGLDATYEAPRPALKQPA